jgi:hypothetical protein
MISSALHARGKIVLIVPSVTGKILGSSARGWRLAIAKASPSKGTPFFTARLILLAYFNMLDESILRYFRDG